MQLRIRCCVLQLVAVAQGTSDARALFGRKAFLINLAVDVGCLFEAYALCFDDAACCAADHDVVAVDAAFDRGFDVDDQKFAGDVAVNLALDEDIALALEVTAHRQPLVDDRAIGCTGFGMRGKGPAVGIGNAGQ